MTGVFVSWFSFKYNTPNIEVEKTTLVIPDRAFTLKGQAVKQLESAYLTFELEIVVRNQRGGAGSIDKPNLLLKSSCGKRFMFFTEYKNMIIRPVTQHAETEKYDGMSGNVFTTSTIRHGRSFNLNGGEKVDDNLEYVLSKPERIHEYVNQFENATYFIEYCDNNGKRHERKIERIVSQSSIDPAF